MNMFARFIVWVYVVVWAVGAMGLAYVANGFRYWTDGSTPRYSLLEHALFYGLFIGLPVFVVWFIVRSLLRPPTGRRYRVLFFLLFSLFTLAAAACLLLGDDEALLFGLPTALFLPAWWIAARPVRQPAPPG